MPEGVEAPPLYFHMHGGGMTGGDYAWAENELLCALCEDGVASASIEYRLYPNAKYPDFIEDCARAVDFLLNKSDYKFTDIFAGGSSAGGYLSMMLFFDKHYLGAYGIDPWKFAGWIFNAGQPTVHFNVLTERGLDSRLLRVDEAAPLYHITGNYPADPLPRILHIAASSDMPCRLEQVKLLQATMRHFGYPDSKNTFMYMNGFSHTAYNGNPDFIEAIKRFIRQ